LTDDECVEEDPIAKLIEQVNQLATALAAKAPKFTKRVRAFTGAVAAYKGQPQVREFHDRLTAAAEQITNSIMQLGSQAKQVGEVSSERLIFIRVADKEAWVKTLHSYLAAQEVLKHHYEKDHSYVVRVRQRLIEEDSAAYLQAQRGPSLHDKESARTAAEYRRIAQRLGPGLRAMVAAQLLFEITQQAAVDAALKGYLKTIATTVQIMDRNLKPLHGSNTPHRTA
jgi:hypothetical protein